MGAKSGYGRLDGFLLRDIAMNKRPHLGKASLLQIKPIDRRAFGLKPAGDTESNSRAGSGDNSYTAGQGVGFC